MEEIWKPIPGAPLYEASSLGRVRNAETGLVLKDRRKSDGYRHICISPAPGLRWHKKTHQLVALAFLGPKPFPKAHVAHADGTRDNNVVANLRWATCKENHADREKHGRAPKGSRNGAARLAEADVTHIRERLARGATQAVLAAEFGVSGPLISAINTRRLWRHI